jgi:hypothetical protein
MRATRHLREHHASVQRGQRGKSTPTAAQVAQQTRSRMSREVDSIDVSVGGVWSCVCTGRDRRVGAVEERTGGGGRTILTRS